MKYFANTNYYPYQKQPRNKSKFGCLYLRSAIYLLPIPSILAARNSYNKMLDWLLYCTNNALWRKSHHGAKVFAHMKITFSCCQYTMVYACMHVVWLSWLNNTHMPWVPAYRWLILLCSRGLLTC